MSDFSGKIALTIFETDKLPVLYASVADSNKGIAFLEHYLHTINHYIISILN